MLSITTVTQKGQITIPIAIRNALELVPFDRVQIPDLLSMGGSIKPIKGKSALKARDWMEKNYRRV